MHTSQFGGFNNLVNYWSTNQQQYQQYQQQQQQHQQWHPLGLYNYYASNGMYVSKHIHQSADQTTRPSSNVYNSGYNYNQIYSCTEAAMGAHYEHVLKSQFRSIESQNLQSYLLPTWTAASTEFSKQQQQMTSTDVEINSASLSNIPHTYPLKLPSPGDWLTQIPYISPLSVDDRCPVSYTLSEITSQAPENLSSCTFPDVNNRASNDSTFRLSPSDNSIQQTSASAGQSKSDNLNCTPSCFPRSLLLSPVPILPYTALLQNACADLKKPKTRRRYIKCKCPNCWVPGGNITIGQDGVPEHVCYFSNCRKTFNRVAILNQHLRSCHSVDPVICEICKKTFTRKDGYNRHMKIHRGEKNFECPQCGKDFTRKDHLKKHVDKIHNRSGKNKKSTLLS